MIALLVLAQTLLAQTPFKNFTCGGGIQGNRCEVQFYFQKCQSYMELVWPKLYLQGKQDWDKTRANWCSVRFWSEKKIAREEKLPVERCDKILDAFADALRVHPEKPWEDGVCSLTNPTDGLVVAKQAPEFQNAKSVLLAGAGLCELQKSNPRKRGEKIRVALACPYPDDRVQGWLQEFSHLTGVPVSFFNPSKVASPNK